LNFNINKISNIKVIIKDIPSDLPVENIDFIFIQNIGAYKRISFSYENNILEDQFIEVLVQGKASLYYVPFNNDEKYIIDTKEDGMILLSNKEKIIQKNEKSYKQEKPYIYTLIYLLRDCPKLKTRIANTKYDHNSMIALLRRYNKCVGVSELFVNKPEPQSIMQLGPVISFGSSKFNFSDVDKVIVLIDEIKFKSTKDINIGLFYNIHPFKANRKFNVGMNFFYHTVSYLSIGNYYSTGSFSRKISDVEFSLSEILLIPSSSLIIPAGEKSNFFITIGVSLGIPLNKTRELTGKSLVLIDEAQEITFTSHISHNSSYGIKFDFGYQINILKQKSISIFGTFNYGTFNIFSKPDPVTKVELGLRMDLL
jgi:hypothetical protein